MRKKKKGCDREDCKHGCWHYWKEGPWEEDFLTSKEKDTGVHGVYGSDNDLITEGPKLYREGSCQVSSGLWCQCALKGKEQADPVKVNDVTLQQHVRVLRWDDTGEEQIVTSMKRVMNQFGLKQIEPRIVKTGVDALEAMTARNGVWLIWMAQHMVAFYHKSSAELYFYDNTAGLVWCTSLDAVTKWARWVCRRNREWNDGQQRWICLQCERAA